MEKSLDTEVVGAGAEKKNRWAGKISVNELLFAYTNERHCSRM